MTWPIRVYDSEEDTIFCLDINNAAVLVAASNIPYYYPKEALKAQIIIARTYLARKMRSLGGDGCYLHEEADICKNGHCIPFLSNKELATKWGDQFDEIWQCFMELERETEGQIITLKNKPILPCFHKACGGSTENSENVNGNVIPYLRKTYCDYCQNNTEDIQKVDLSIDEIESVLNTKTSTLNWQEGPKIKGFIEEIQRDEEGRIKSIKIGNNIYKGQEIAEKLGLCSNRFGWQPKVITFESKGIGNGLGMCQYGAKMMCLEGKSAEEIIKYFYTNVDIAFLRAYNPSKPLNGRKLLLDPGNGAKIEGTYYGRDILLNICTELQKRLTELGAEVYLTRTTNEFCSTQDKVKMVDRVIPEFYISINCNYEKNFNLAGTEIFHFRGDIESQLLGKNIQKKMKSCTELLQKGIKVAQLSLFKEIKINALLIELGYLSNEHDKSILLDESQQFRISKAIAEGIKAFYLRE